MQEIRAPIDEGLSRRQRMLVRFGLACLVLLVSLPFLFPLHTTPIPSFHAEWLAAVLGLAAATALIGTHRLPLPGAALLALALAAVALVQIVSGLAPVPQLSTLFVLYLLWAGLLACVGRRMAQTFGHERIGVLLAASMLCGSLLAALLGFAQPWLASFGWPGYPLAAGGPLGQANHLNVYLWLGLASATYLRVARKLPGIVFWSAAGLLTFAAVSVGQRSSFLYAAALIAIAFWQWRQASKIDAPDGHRMALGVGALFVLMQPLPGLLPIGTGDVRPPPALRAMQQYEGPSIRWQLLHLGFTGIADAPLTGGGVGSYASLAYAKADTIAPQDNPGPAEHGHNLLVDLAVELGLPAAVLVAIAALHWLLRLSQRAAPAETGWTAAVVTMIGLHCMVEYPLWHTYFLGLLAIVAGAFGGGRQVGTRLSAVALSVGLVAWGSSTLLDLQRDYSRLELALGLGKASPKPLADAALLSIPPSSLLAPWVQTTACVSLDPLGVSVADGLAVCRPAMAFAPTPESGVGTAVLWWRSGWTAKAEDLLHRIQRASPDHDIDALLDPLVVRDERVNALRGGIGSAQ